MTEWQVAGSPERYETEGQALAAAWAVTPAGGHRPDVVRAPPRADPRSSDSDAGSAWLDMRELSITPNYDDGDDPAAYSWADAGRYKDRIYKVDPSITMSAVVTCPLGVAWDDAKAEALQSLAKVAKVRGMILVPGSEKFEFRISGGAMSINEIQVEVVARVP